MNQILVFGGAAIASYNAYTFDEEGELLEDISDDPFIPGYVCNGSFVVRKGNVYAVS